MSGTKGGAQKAKATNLSRHGKDFYRHIGHLGGSVSRPETRWFSLHPGLAKAAGSKGGRKSKRGKAEKNEKIHFEEGFADI